MKFLCKFRTLNHKLPVETGRYINIPRNQRYCTLCNSNQFGDEYHFLLECITLSAIRKKFIPEYFYKSANVLKFSQLLNADVTLLNKVCKFIIEGFKLL